MFKKALLFAIVLGIAPAFAQDHTVIGNDVISGAPQCAIGPCWRPYVGAPPAGYQQFTVATATALPSIPVGAVEAFVICTGQTVNWRDDGTNPTTTIGMPLATNTPFPYTGNLAAIKFIQVTATASCNVSYYY